MTFDQRLQDFCRDMGKSNKAGNKKAVLADYPDMKDLLRVVYDPYSRFHITSANLKKRSGRTAGLKTKAPKRRGGKRAPAPEPDDPIHIPADFFELLDLLKKRMITGNEAITVAQAFLDKKPPAVQEILQRALDKDLKIGVQAKTINAVFPGLVPEFRVVLAEQYEKHANKIEWDGWYSSRKLDGCRCIASIDEEGNVSFFSRQGMSFDGPLAILEQHVKQLGFRNVVLDGEICIIGPDGNEDFDKVVSMIRRKNQVIENPAYRVFDMIPMHEFLQGQGESCFSERQKQLKKAFAKKQTARCRYLKQTLVKSQEHLTELSSHASDQGWEGLILRHDVPYAAKRDRHTLKVKKFQDAEFIVKEVFTGDFQVVKDGKKSTIETMTAVGIELKGNPVRVGSGFSIEDRAKVFANPESIIGSEITVQYFEETKDGSLRFPTVKQIWWGKRDS